MPYHTGYPETGDCGVSKYKDRVVETELTPELASMLLANPHPKQRKIGQSTVDKYARTIKDGRWALVPDPIMVADQPDGRMFNGGHRCRAVVVTGITIPVLIDWGADPDLFDKIDVVRKRQADQFITEADGYARASAARLCLWYRFRFEKQPMGVNVTFDVDEILAEVEAREPQFDMFLPLARDTYQLTGLSRSVALAAYSIAGEMGYVDEVHEFVSGVADFSGLGDDDPRRALAERFRKQVHRQRRRQTSADWTVLVRTLNQYIEGVPVNRVFMTDIWPRVGEGESAFRRRRNSEKALLRRILATRSGGSTAPAVDVEEG
jgi:hypothetical protein